MSVMEMMSVRHHWHHPPQPPVVSLLVLCLIQCMFSTVCLAYDWHPTLRRCPARCFHECAAAEIVSLKRAGPWLCTACALINEASSDTCAICFVPAPLANVPGVSRARGVGAWVCGLCQFCCVRGLSAGECGQAA